MTINKNNAQVAAAVLHQRFLKVVQAGDLEITVQATTDVPVREEYINATVAHAATGRHRAGRKHSCLMSPGSRFRLFDPADPQAGPQDGLEFTLSRPGRYLAELGNDLVAEQFGQPRTFVHFALYADVTACTDLAPSATSQSGPEMVSCTKITLSLCAH